MADPLDRPSAVVELDAVVPREFHGRRVDWVATQLFQESEPEDGPVVSRSELSRWIRAGLLSLDDRAVKPKTPVAAGQRIRLRAERLPRFDWSAAEALAFGVVYEDPHILVVDKPAGLVVHPGAGNPRGTLVNGLLRHRPTLAELPRAGLIQRLDKDTSGLMVVAGNESSLKSLLNDMQARRIERSYLAVVEGTVATDRRIDFAIGRDRRNRLRQSVRQDGRAAVTHVAVRTRFSAHTLIEAQLETGRTHQIRVHMACIGHPLVGDRRYGARRVVPASATATDAEVVRRFPRQALHAYRLAFTHPASGERVAFQSDLPEDMRCLRHALEAH
ncbi:MAG: RluA family pseudouridine synthase [Gammaproteobacteria bacterium]|nr:RluA family pseudouridine synthase [Gammaproteobacteria bacterium]MYF30395.1 RluA family pseudouridine synthase [Gammaproteobacteria bacterium]MYK46771.1 RluA family pseudouridine synthase [Gammaproteobacteria bacterium]